MNPKLALAAIPLIALASVAAAFLASSTWDDVQEIGVDLTTGTWDPVIGSYKILGCCCTDDHGEHEYNITVSDDTAELNLSHPGCMDGHGKHHSLWVGLVVENDGTVPVTLHGVTVSSDGNLSYTAYLYGPLESIGNSGYWGQVNCSELPLNNSVDHVVVYRSDKAVVWIQIEAPEDVSQMSIRLDYAIGTPG